MPYCAELYVHDLDRQAAAALNRFPRFLKLMEAYSANVDEKAAKIDFLSSAVRLGEGQMPEVYEKLPPICEKLGIETPELYYVKSKEMNAAAGGCRQPYIFVTSALVEKLPQRLLPSVLAHECGHIACRHMLYHSLAMMLLKGIDNSPLTNIPGVRTLLTPTLCSALLFWDRCSELSADRAAVLCDGSSDGLVDTLLWLNGYGENVNREAFLQQALDLRSYVNDDKTNRLMECMLTASETHPRMATRAYESYEWSHSAQYAGILDGTFTRREKEAETKRETEEEAVNAEVRTGNASPDDINAALDRVNAELAKCTCRADRADYALAVANGLLFGLVDSLFVGKITITNGGIALSHQEVNNFIQEYAKARGYDKSRLKDAIAELEKAFPVAQDNVWKGADIGVSAKNHHLADLAHHPTALGLMASLVVQFLRIGTFVNKNGEWHFCFVKTAGEDVLKILIPAILTGVLNWLAAAAEKKYADENEELPKEIRRLLHIVASTPMIVEVIKAADNWFGHLVSDMGGSKNTAGEGMGIPGILLSLLYEIAALPMLRKTGLPAYLDRLYEKQRFDLRHEIPLYKAAGKQALPVLAMEVSVRLCYFIAHLAPVKADGTEAIDWNCIVPIGNRTAERMITVASMTFNVADTADAAIRAAVESGGNWVLFSGNFAARYNYIGAARAALAIVREVSYESRETQLIHEKMLLSEAKAAQFLAQLQQYKEQLDRMMCTCLAEDLEEFMTGLADMESGLRSGNSDAVILGSCKIQKVLGREPQFTNQTEFDALMESDAPLVL